MKARLVEVFNGHVTGVCATGQVIGHNVATPFVFCKRFFNFGVQQVVLAFAFDLAVGGRKVPKRGLPVFVNDGVGDVDDWPLVQFIFHPQVVKKMFY